ncbi:beta-taxilin [Lepeophtheirus salmonis]|uniref:beta-taxilin n=1 Tax=Lepeophtheirus salmonis TaxID=72036 RepID=UPI00077EFC9D|nr:beta-taxilin-like [Lepeophtheirus salmonis]XP_040569474.1 beta-taxilin-like [Lepeophtheirus salmonis]XP_040569476.1 beta-taxilin-like [Lepeophtheirus salmonis]XP_040569477.1 beta-taxilin-like [Lepeophtheirus salmonis]
MEMEMKEPINAIIEALKLDKHSSEEKLVIVVDHLRKVSNSNISYKEENINLKEQLAKSDETKVALKKLTDALRAQINLTKEENTLKLKEETQKRLECSIMFEEQIKELAVLVTTQSENNTKLREENLSITEKISELINAYEAEQRKHTERSLQLQLFEAQLSKAKVERAEQTAEHTQDRLGLQQVILELREENDLYRQRERLMKEQIEIYTAQSQEVEKSLGDSGSSIQHFRKQIEKLNLKLQQVECDTAEWRHKFEASNEQVKKMNKLSLERDREMEIFKKKLAVMENLNRALHEELKNTKNSN